MKLRKTDIDFIKSQSVARLATVMSGGMPHNIPVCPVFDGGNIYVASEKGAVKIKNIQTNPMVGIVFDVYRDSWRGLRGIMLQCHARLVDDTEFKKIRRKLYAKYPKYPTDAPLEPEDSVIIELIPEKKLTWGFK
jgi:nitroimidazol reductase NimA-like FMN-containing flavoprotein (pyridoxamine 5'-phosphate oxidase superfamily)